MTFARSRLGFDADAKQALVLRSEVRRGLLNCTRQWGKSTVTAAKAVHHAFSREKSLTLVLSPSERQSAEFLRKAEGFVRTLGIRPRGDGDNEVSLLLPNGSRIVGLPGKEATVRGFSAVSLMLIDEAARVSDELYQAVRPMLAVGDGALWLMSTPCGCRGFFYDAWMERPGEWERVTVQAPECPRIPKRFLDEERRTKSDRMFRQEYLCEFLDGDNSLFSRDVVMRSIRHDIPALLPHIQWSR